MGGDKQMFVGNAISQYILGEGTGSLGSAFTVVSGVVLILTALFWYWLMEKLISRGSKHV